MSTYFFVIIKRIPPTGMLKGSVVFSICVVPKSEDPRENQATFENPIIRSLAATRNGTFYTFELPDYREISEIKFFGTPVEISEGRFKELVEKYKLQPQEKLFGKEREEAHIRSLNETINEQAAKILALEKAVAEKEAVIKALEGQLQKTSQ